MCGSDIFCCFKLWMLHNMNIYKPYTVHCIYHTYIHIHTHGGTYKLFATWFLFGWFLILCRFSAFHLFRGFSSGCFSRPSRGPKVSVHTGNSSGDTTKGERQCFVENCKVMILYVHFLLICTKKSKLYPFERTMVAGDNPQLQHVPWRRNSQASFNPWRAGKVTILGTRWSTCSTGPSFPRITKVATPAKPKRNSQRKQLPLYIRVSRKIVPGCKNDTKLLFWEEIGQSQIHFGSQ